MPLPLLRLTGCPYEQGRQHGRDLKDRIDHNLAIYFERFERDSGLSRAEVLERGDRYAEVVTRQNPDYAAGMRGIADGSGLDPRAIAALNVRYEIIYYQVTAKAMADTDGCTAFAVLPEAAANRHLLIGQNWDWIPGVLGAVLETEEPDGLRTLAFTEAGILGGKIGLNSAGLGLAINGMNSTDDDWSRLARPFHVRCYEILRSPDFESAVEVITGEARSCSTNFLVAQAPDRVVDIEAAPHRFRAVDCRGGCLVHANHFTAPEEIGVEEPPSDRRPFSRLRHSRLEELLSSRLPVSIADIQSYLQDHERHPQSICRHPDPALPPQQHTVTVASAIMDLDARTLLLTDRQPCVSKFEAYRLNGSE